MGQMRIAVQIFHIHRMDEKTDSRAHTHGHAQREKKHIDYLNEMTVKQLIDLFVYCCIVSIPQHRYQRTVSPPVRGRFAINDGELCSACNGSTTQKLDRASMQLILGAEQSSPQVSRRCGLFRHRPSRLGRYDLSVIEGISEAPDK